MTNRQKLIALALADGWPTNRIAAGMNLTPRTIQYEILELQKQHDDSLAGQADRHRGQQAQAESMRNFVKQSA